MIKVIAFDLDDTLWDVAPIIHRAESTLGDWLDREVPGLAYSIETMRTLRSDVLLKDPWLSGKITELRRRVIEEAMLRSGIERKDADRLSSDAIDVFLTARNEIELFEGAFEALASLSKRFTLGALSNGNADIARLGLGKVFSFAFSAEQVGAPKPAHDLFLAALAHTRSEPHEMVYVGDDARFDMDPAKKLGLKTVWVKRSGDKALGETTPDQVISHVRHVEAAIENLVNPDAN